MTKRSNAPTQSKKTAKAVKNKAYYVQNLAKMKLRRQTHCQNNVQRPSCSLSSTLYLMQAYDQKNAAKIKLYQQARYQKNAQKFKVRCKLHSQKFKAKHHSEQANVLQNNAGVRTP